MLRLGPNMTLIFIFEFDFVRTGLFDRVDTKVLMSDKSEPYCDMYPESWTHSLAN